MHILQGTEKIDFFSDEAGVITAIAAATIEHSDSTTVADVHKNIGQLTVVEYDQAVLEALEEYYVKTEDVEPTKITCENGNLIITSKGASKAIKEDKELYFIAYSQQFQGDASRRVVAGKVLFGGDLAYATNGDITTETLNFYPILVDEATEIPNTLLDTDLVTAPSAPLSISAGESSVTSVLDIAV